MSRGCLATRVAPELLLETVRVDNKVEVREAGLAGEPLGTESFLMVSISGLGMRVPLLSAPGLLLCPVTPRMVTVNFFTFTFNCQWQKWFLVCSPRWRTGILLP